VHAQWTLPGASRSFCQHPKSATRYTARHRRHPVKLLIYSHFFAPSVGGVERIVLSLARGLSELRSAQGQGEFEITVVTHTPAMGTPAGNYDDRALPFRVVRQPSLAQLWRLIRDADVIHAAGPALAPLFLAYLARKPVVMEHHGYQTACLNGLFIHQPERSVCPGHFQAGEYGECLRCQGHETSRIRGVINLLLMFPRDFLARRAAANIHISQHVLERLALPCSSVVYYGVDAVAPVPAATSATAPTVTFSYVGRLVPEKGLPVLLAAADILKRNGHRFELLFIGDGPERPKLQETIESSGLSSCARITGFLEGAAFEQALRGVGVVVMSSVWEETAGLAAIEQMMRGRLVIASAIGGLGEVVGEAGLRCAPGDAQALADCMLQVLQNPALIDLYGQKARDRALQLFGRPRMIEDHARIYRQAFSASKIR
jgi:glycogen(starch) synthase